MRTHVARDLNHGPFRKIGNYALILSHAEEDVACIMRKGICQVYDIGGMTIVHIVRLDFPLRALHLSCRHNLIHHGKLSLLVAVHDLICPSVGRIFR